MKRMIKYITLALCSLTSSAIFADNYVVVSKDTKIFDSPNVKGYVTLNTQNQEVAPSAGMVFKALESANGWFLVEYSPGLRGYLSTQMTATPKALPDSGVYPVANKKGTSLKVSRKGESWEGEASGLRYSGINDNNVLVFVDSDNNPTYSVVDFGNGPIVYCYDNNITKFF